MRMIIEARIVDSAGGSNPIRLASRDLYIRVEESRLGGRPGTI